MKHGPLALVENGMPVIVIAPKDRFYEKTISNMQEVIARGGKILLISEKKNYDTKPPKTVGFHLNLIPVEDFKIFLTNWCTFLQSENVEEILNLIKNAA